MRSRIIPAEPVVCLDEKPVCLHSDVRAPIPAKPGAAAKRDNEYKRRGAAHVFGVVEPKAGRRYTTATPNRSAVQFAQTVYRRHPRSMRRRGGVTTALSVSGRILHEISKLLRKLLKNRRGDLQTHG